MKNVINGFIGSGSLFIVAGALLIIFNFSDTGAALGVPIMIMGIVIIGLYFIIPKTKVQRHPHRHKPPRKRKV